MKKQCILKKSQTNECRKILNKNFLILSGLCLLQIILALIGQIFGWVDHKEFFGITYNIFCIVSICIIYKLNKEYVIDTPTESKQMTTKTFFECFTILVATIFLFTIPVVIFDMILSKFDLTLINVAGANVLSDGIAQFIYAAFLGPICEEVIFRGMIQKSLSKFSPVFAILISAISFGIYHGNFSQMFSMFGAGLVLGYVAYKFSIKWSIIIHIIYNSIIGELFAIITEVLKKGDEDYLLPIINQTPFMTVMLILSIIGMTFMTIRFFKGKVPFQNYSIKFKKTLILFTSIPFIVFLIYNLGTSLLLIEKI